MKKRHWLSRISFGTVSLAMTVLLVLSYLSVIIDPAKAWFFTLFGLLYPVVLLVTAVLFIWSLVRRSHMRLVLFLVLLPSLFFAGRYFRFREKEPQNPATLKIVSYNVGLFAHGQGEQSRLALADSVSAWLNSLDADILCLQEFFLPTDVPMERWLKKHFPGYDAQYYVTVNKNGCAGNLTLSRRPVVAKGKHSFEKSANLALWTDIKLDSSTVRIYNCHFESYNISLSGLVKGMGNDHFREQTERKMRRSITERPKQVADVLRGVESAPVRSLVLGDFNDGPLSYTYFRLLRGRRDSFTRAGKGFGATYRSLWPLLRIDYMLYPKDLEAVSFHIGKQKYSDHYPLISTYYETGRNTW